MFASERGCCVPRCGKTRKDDKILHSFPNPDIDKDRFIQWIRAVGVSGSLNHQYVYRNRRVCHAHFEAKYLTWTKRLSPDAVPTLLLCGNTISIPESNESSEENMSIHSADEVKMETSNQPLLHVTTTLTTDVSTPELELHASAPDSSLDNTSKEIKDNINLSHSVQINCISISDSDGSSEENKSIHSADEVKMETSNQPLLDVTTTLYPDVSTPELVLNASAPDLSLDNTSKEIEDNINLPHSVQSMQDDKIHECYTFLMSMAKPLCKLNNKRRHECMQKIVRTIMDSTREQKAEAQYQ